MRTPSPGLRCIPRGAAPTHKQLKSWGATLPGTKLRLLPPLLARPFGLCAISSKGSPRRKENLRAGCLASVFMPRQGVDGPRASCAYVRLLGPATSPPFRHTSPRPTAWAADTAPSSGAQLKQQWAPSWAGLPTGTPSTRRICQARVRIGKTDLWILSRSWPPRQLHLTTFAGLPLVIAFCMLLRADLTHKPPRSQGNV